jgi:hypothetical protein
MAKKLSLFLIIVLILTLCISIPVSAEYAKVDISKVTSTGVGEPDTTGFVPETVFDGDEDTRWGSMQAGESLTAVFDKEYTIEAVEMRFFRAGVREHLFTFEYSLDGSNWTEIKSTKANSTADPSLQSDDDDLAQQEGYFETFPLVNSVNAVYFRYTYEGRNDGATIGSLWDMRFVAGAGGAAVATPEVVPEVIAPEILTEVAPEVVAPPTTQAPAKPVTPSAKTGDPITLIVIGSIISAAGVVISKKRK